MSGFFYLFKQFCEILNKLPRFAKFIFNCLILFLLIHFIKYLLDSLSNFVHFIE